MPVPVGLPTSEGEIVVTTYLITYDVHDDSRRQDVLDYLQDVLQAEMVTESSYLALSNETARSLVDEIKGIADDEISVYVFPVAACAGYGKEALTRQLSAMGLVLT